MAKQTAPVKKNQTITLQFEDLTHEGNGVGKINGYPLFVPYALPGEEGDVKVVKVNKNYGFGKLLKLQASSSERVEPPCHVYYQCGGCQLQHMSYNKQLDMKQEQVKNTLRKVAHLEHVPVHTISRMDDPWRYRNKVQMPVGETNDGELKTGFYQKRSHRIIDGMETCVIQDEVNDRMVEGVRRIASRLGLSAYDETHDTGVLRHIVVRTAAKTKDTMIVLITRTPDLPHKDELVDELLKIYPHITSIIHHINDRETNAIWGEKSQTIWGDDYIKDQIGDLTFAVSARSFYQVNPPQTTELYNQALAYANLGANDTVVDAYCGIGTLSLFMAKEAKQVYGVEVVPDAVDDAKKNARLNQITNATFYTGEAEKIMPWWTAQGMHPNVMVVDPPRKGCDEELLQAMIGMAPDRIVYVSCNPSTLARDLRILEDGGYAAKEVQPVDMFPQTHHVEAVCRLERKTAAEPSV